MIWFLVKIIQDMVKSVWDSLWLFILYDEYFLSFGLSSWFFGSINSRDLTIAVRHKTKLVFFQNKQLHRIRKVSAFKKRFFFFSNVEIKRFYDNVFHR
jgi:hypothetical protein